MTEKSSEFVHLEGDEANVSPLLPAMPQAFQPDGIWNFVGSCWKYPNWHGASFRHIELPFFRKKGSKETIPVRAARSLNELSALFVAIIGYGHLYREDVVGTHSPFKRFCIATQTLLTVNRRSINIHDRVSLIPSLAGYVESHCVVCSMFHAFRHLILTRQLDSTCGTPSEWEASVAGGGEDAFLVLLQRFETASDGHNIGEIHADDLRRFPAFVKGLMKASMPVEKVAVISQSAAPMPMSHAPEPKTEKAEPVNVTVNVALSAPINMTQNADSTAHNEAVAANANNNQATANGVGNHADAQPASATDSSTSDSQDETPKPQEQEKADERAMSNSDATDDAAPQAENESLTESPDIVADASAHKAEQPPQAVDEIIADAHADADSQDDAANADAASPASEATRKPRGRTKYQTSQSLQYVVLCILCDLHKSNREASLTADELAAEVRRKNKKHQVDKTDCYRIINDLKLVLSNARSDWQISTGDYRLIAPPYGRADKLKTQFEKLNK